MSIKKTTEEFVKEAQALNPSYDYSQVVYCGNKIPVQITCDKGHTFMQTPNHHLRGEGCPYCAGSVPMKQEDFLQKAISVHGDRYDYSLVVYSGANKKVKIICPIHGEFEQIPYLHLNGAGCRKCGHMRDNEEFKETLRSIYGDKYDFSLAEWRGREKKVKIICPKHGVVERVARYLLSGDCGCTKCYKESTRLTQEEFLERARQIHGDTFDYSETKYQNALTPIKIKCKKGHIFETTPQNFLYSASGCSICYSEARSSGERKVRWYLTQHNIEFKEQKTFDGCKYKRKLQFDFYLPKENLCIEFQGEQHYRPSLGEDEFKIQQIRDNIKRKFCKEHGIDLLEIKYNDPLIQVLQEKLPQYANKERKYNKLKKKVV